jgi:hypothetical protein
MRALLRRRAEDDAQGGAALVAVILLTAVMLVAVSVSLTGATSGVRQATAAQSTTRALDAAYAGVQDYIAKLNADSTYPQYGNKDADFSSTSTVKLPTTSNPAFGIGTAGTWANLPGSTTNATFRYEVDNSQYGSSGLLRLRSTGRYGSSTRTIVASIQQQGFINYLYFTNYEIQDPKLTGTSANCDRYLWASPTRSTSSCPTIQFGPNDVLDGPVRSNDTITVCGSTFNGPVTSSNPGSPIVATPSSCSSRATYNAASPTYLPVLAMPDTNSSMKAQTYSDTATNPGCLYTGPTQITLNNDGTMTVVSPWTQYTNVTSDGTQGSNPAGCGTLTDLHSTKGATVTVPSSNLVYVQSVPTSTTDVNYTTAAATKTTTTTSTCTRTQYNAGNCTTSSGANCTSSQYNAGNCAVVTTTTSNVTNGAVPSSVTTSSWASNATYTCTGSDGSAMPTSGSSGSAGWIFKDSNGTLRYPLATEDPASNWSVTTSSYFGSTTSWDTTTPAYGCRDGDAFVSGTLSGKLTIASDNYVYATGDILYKDSNSDVLGLVGNNGVLVWNPMNGSTPLITAKNREIDAAILSPVHTFQVQNYDVGPYRGTLTIDGSIAQKYRGPVAQTSGNTTTTGYAKNYEYDSRFITVTPPYYLKPTSASVRVSSYASTNAAFASSGAAQ